MLRLRLIWPRLHSKSRADGGADAWLSQIGFTGPCKTDARAGSWPPTFHDELGTLLGPGCVYLAEWVVFDDRKFRGCKEAYTGVCIDSKTRLDPELIGFCQESKVRSSLYHSLQKLDNLVCRYNSRDSPWWMLQNIQDYAKSAPEGVQILSETVKRRFPEDDTWVPWDDARAYAYACTLAEIVQEILQRHADGIHFREYNAGPNLDMQMKDEGFNIDIHVDWETGLILGGNDHNCGTWMDKMGESVKAGTKGVPGTPRDGAPVEITGLLKSTLRWLAELSSKDKFPFKGVQAESKSP